MRPTHTSIMTNEKDVLLFARDGVNTSERVKNTAVHVVDYAGNHALRSGMIKYLKNARVVVRDGDDASNAIGGGD